MKTIEVEYYRLWENHTWDTHFIRIPADTPEDEMHKAIEVAARKIDWKSDTPVAVGLYHYSYEDQDDDAGR